MCSNPRIPSRPTRDSTTYPSAARSRLRVSANAGFHDSTTTVAPLAAVFPSATIFHPLYADFRHQLRPLSPYAMQGLHATAAEAGAEMSTGGGMSVDCDFLSSGVYSSYSPTQSPICTAKEPVSCAEQEGLPFRRRLSRSHRKRK